MAIQTICGILLNGQDTVCNPLVRRYYQQAIVINKDDVDTSTVTTPTVGQCDYKVNFALKAGKSGLLFISPEAGNSVKGFSDKTTAETGHPQFIHHVQFLVTGVNEEAKCILDALSRGSYFVVLQLKDGTVEVFGFEQGLVAPDFTYDIQENGGGVVMLLDSLETAPENFMPLVYESATPGGETADFDSLFAQ